LLKILCITRNYEGYTAQGEYAYLQELNRQADVKFLGNGFPDYKGWMSLPDYIKEHYADGPDIIYYSQCTTENPGVFKDVKHTRAPKVCWMHNGHNYRQQQIDRIHNWDTKLVLHRSWAPHFFWYMTRLECPMLFHPQAVDANMFKDYHEPKDIDVAFPGIVIPHYKLRVAAQHRLKVLRNNGLKVWMTWHPGYPYNIPEKYEEFKRRGFLWREDYARMMNRCKLLITCGGLFNVVVRKFWEAMASDTLLLATRPLFEWTYGLEPGANYVPVNLDNWEHEMNYYLGDECAQRRIRGKAKQLVRKRHTTKIRVRELLSIFKSLLSGDLVEEEVKPREQEEQLLAAAS